MRICHLVLMFLIMVLGTAFEASASSETSAVATAHPLATKAGLNILSEGGNAVDAAIAVSFALSVVEPWSSGIGGGAFMVVRMNGQTRTWDMRETAPRAASRSMYVKDGKVVRGLSTKTALAAGIPGLVRGLATLHAKYGKLPFSRLVQPAIRLARGGFAVSKHLRQALAGVRDGLNGAAKNVFLEANGMLPALGTKLKQPDLARTLERIAKTRGEDFYTGSVARELVRSVKAAGGIWTEHDLRDYQVKERQPVVGSFRGYEIHSMGPPSSGGLLLVQLLGVREKINSGLTPGASGYEHEMAESTKRAFAMRATGLGDPDYFEVRRENFMSRKVIGEIASQVQSSKRATPATALGQVLVRPSERTDTSHFGVLLANGDAVACTQTINLRFGSGLMAGSTGVMLNNEMDDFSALPGVPNAFGLVGDEANSIAPGKRPLSSMTPTLVVRKGKAVGVFGSPGGSRIITTTYQSIVNVIEHRWSVKQAIAYPRIHHQWYPDAIFYESGRFTDSQISGLKRLGHTVRESSIPMGNAMGLWRDEQGHIEAIADPRGEGTGEVIRSK